MTTTAVPNPTTKYKWQQVPGKLKQISVGSASQIWGVNKNDEIFQYVNNQWQKISGGLKHVSVAADGTVWGVNANDQIYQYLGNNQWKQISGGLKQISVGSASQIWGVNKNDEIFRYINNQWQKIDGKLKYVSVAADGTVWGVNANDDIFRFEETKVEQTNQLPKLGCENEKQLRSVDGGAATSINFVNKTSALVKVYWINAQGQRQFFKDLKPGESFNQSTYVNHPWVVTDEQGGCLGIFQPEKEPKDAIIEGNKTPSTEAALSKVSIFAAINFGGASQEIGVGSYDLKDLSIGGDVLSSLKVPAGYKVTLYEHPGFQGKSKTYTSDASFVGEDFNDKTSSIRIERIQDSLPTPGKYYYLTNKNSGKVVDVADGSTADGANIQQYSKANGDNQKWEFQDAGDGYYYIISKKSGKAVGVAGGSTGNTADGANVIQWAKVATANDQKWKLEDAGDGYFYIVNKNSGKVLDVEGNSLVDKGNVLQYQKTGNDNQKWKFEAV